MRANATLKLIGRASQVAGLLITIRLVTTQLGPMEMGKFGIITTLYALFNLGFINPAGTYINRHILIWWRQGLIWRRLGVFALYVPAVALAALLGVSAFFALTQPHWDMELSWVLGLVSAQIVINTANGTLIGSLLLWSKDRQWLWLTIVTQWGGLAISCLLCLFAPRAELWLLGQIIGLALGLAFSLRPFVHATGRPDRPPSTVNDLKETPGYVLSFCLPILVMVISSWVQFQSYRLVLGEWMSLEFLGIFIAGYTVGAGIMAAFETTALVLLLPRFFQQASAGGDGPREAWRAFLAKMVPLTLLTAVFVVTLARPLTWLLISPAYSDAVRFVMLGAVLDMFRVLGGAYALAAHASTETKILVKPSLFGAVGVLLASSIILRIWGTSGFIVALVLVGLVYVGLLAFVATRHMSGHPRLMHPWWTFVGCLCFVVALLLSRISGPKIGTDIALVGVMSIIYLVCANKFLDLLGAETVVGSHDATRS